MKKFTLITLLTVLAFLRSASPVNALENKLDPTTDLPSTKIFRARLEKVTGESGGTHLVFRVTRQHRGQVPETIVAPFVATNEPFLVRPSFLIDAPPIFRLHREYLVLMDGNADASKPLGLSDLSAIFDLNETDDERQIREYYTQPEKGFLEKQIESLPCVKGLDALTSDGLNKSGEGLSKIAASGKLYMKDVLKICGRPDAIECTEEAISLKSVMKFTYIVRSPSLVKRSLGKDSATITNPTIEFEINEAKVTKVNVSSTTESIRKYAPTFRGPH